MRTSISGEIIKDGNYTGTFTENTTVDNSPKNITVDNTNSNVNVNAITITSGGGGINFDVNGNLTIDNSLLSSRNIADPISGNHDTDPLAGDTGAINLLGLQMFWFKTVHLFMLTVTPPIAVVILQ